MDRRQILKFGLGASAVTGLAGVGLWNHLLDGPLINPCKTSQFPKALWDHPLINRAFDGIDVSQLWDSHFHLIGNGNSVAFDGKPSNVWLNPDMTSMMSPIQNIQYEFYLNAACVGDESNADKIYFDNIKSTIEQLPQGIKFLLLAFDYHYSNKGTKEPQQSTFYVPNEYAARVAAAHPSFEWIASVHPYRKDALDELDWCKANGAKAVKWLPPAMNIDPSSSLCDAFYHKLIALNLPLLSHAGDEKAVHSEELQKLANPLLLRRPLDLGVKVIVAHCASLGSNQDLDNLELSNKSNFELFSRLMNDVNYQTNCLADISAINLINREVAEIKAIVENHDWHSRLLFATDYPLPGVMPIISSKNLVNNELLDPSVVSFVNQVRSHSSWLYDFLVKRFMISNGSTFSTDVFHTQRHFS